MEKVTIEVPAGLVDAGETPEECAVRELKEETGYVGAVSATSTVMFPGESPSPLTRLSSFPPLPLPPRPQALPPIKTNTPHKDPGFCNTNLRMVHLTVDMSLPENQNPVAQLEDDEFIEVFHVPLTNLWTECERLAAEGCAIDARVGTLAEGVELAKRFKL